MAYSKAVTEAILALTADLPFVLVGKIADICLAHDDGDVARGHVVRMLSRERPRHQARQLFTLLKQEGVPPQIIAYALVTAAQMKRVLREEQSISLLWTGPDTPKIPVRRNEQALLDLINGAQRELHVVSYVAYRADDVIAALEGAVGRGVAVSLYLETFDKNGNEQLDRVRNLGRELALSCRLYEWPLTVRERIGNGKVGALHAKVAVADGSRLFVSSANLTGYAMHHNMEMGVLFAGGDEPSVVQAHLGKLVEKGVFRVIDSSVVSNI